MLLRLSYIHRRFSLGRKNYLQTKTQITGVLKQKLSSENLLLTVMLCSAWRRALWKSTKTKKCYLVVCQTNCQQDFCVKPIYFSGVFLKSLKNNFQKFVLHMCILAQFQTQLHLGKTAREYTKASRMFESEF